MHQHPHSNKRQATIHPLWAWTEILHTRTRAPKYYHKRSTRPQSPRALKSHPNNGNRPQPPRITKPSKVQPTASTQFRRTPEYQGTFARQPTQPPALDTGIINTIGSHQKTYIHPEPVIIQRGHNPIQMVDMKTKKDDKKTHSVHTNKEGQSPEDTTPDKKHIPKTLRAHPSNPQINIWDRTEEPPTENTPHIVTTSPILTIGSPRNNSNDDEMGITAQNDQKDEPSRTSTKSTGGNRPDSKHTHTYPYARERDINPRTIHTKTRDSKQESTAQPTCQNSHRDTVSIALLGQNSKGTPEPDILIREPIPIQDKLQTAIVDNTTSPITKDIAQDASVPALITISSSEDGSENDGDQPTAQVDWSKISTPQQKNKSGVHISTLTENDTKKTSQSIITINKQDRS